MVEPQATRFWHAALQSGLIDERALAACWDKIPADKRSADAIDRRLARKAVEMGYMTIWQAQQLLAGVRPQALRYDKYILLDMIGQGGMGRVYLAKDVRLNRRVALKVLSRERMNNPRALARFQREAKVGAQLQHENLVRIYDEGEAHGNRYLVMEYIEGKTVGRLIAEHGPMPPGIAARIARQIALGLDHLYQKGLLHRDINPLNILVDREGNAKLTDLGLAIDLGEPEDIVTRDGATVGTFDYISPEQAKHSRSVDIRSDIYSLGCTLYHVLAGRVPFPQPSLPEKLYAHQLLTPDPVSSLVPGISAGLEAAVRRMMAKAPEERFPTPAAVARALEPFQGPPSPLSTIEAIPQVTQLDPASSGLSGIAEPLPLPITPASPGSMTGSANYPALMENSVATAPTPSGSNVLPGIPELDLGPVPRLSDSLTIPRTRVDVGRGRLWVALGVAAAALAILVLLLRNSGALGWTSAQSTTGSRKGQSTMPETGGNTSAQGGAEIAVRWLDDGTETPQPNLHDAVRQAVGKRAEVVLRNAKALELKGDKTIGVSGGAVVIRAQEGSRPSLAVRLAPDRAFLTVSANASLKLVGLNITFGDLDATKPGTPLLIDSQGNLALDRCTFTRLGDKRESHVAKASGLRTTVTGCWFDGFDLPLVVESFPKSALRIVQCLFTGYQPGESRAGWCAAVTYRGARGDLQGSRSDRHLVTIDRTTVVGAGLLALYDVSTDSPLSVEVSGTVVRAGSILQWRKERPFPTGLQWSGKDNRYVLQGAAWVVTDALAIDGLAKGPTDLETWTAAVGAEPGTLADPLKLEGADSPSVAREPSDFAVSGDSGKTAGIDPAYVGPGAKAVDVK
jgi:serine/threonine protein kinase